MCRQGIVTIIACLITACWNTNNYCFRGVDAATKVDKVVFQWVNSRGVVQSVTQTSAPWTLPTANSNGGSAFSYFATVGKKNITAQAFYQNKLLKSETILLDIIDSRVGRCDNLIKNSDMSLGYKGYWTYGVIDRITNIQSAFGQSVNAIRYVRRRSSKSGPVYVGSGTSAIDTTCLIPGSTWDINARVALMKSSRGVACTVGVDCPTPIITITDSSGNVVLSYTANTYVGNQWNKDSFNTIKSTFTLPSTKIWNGSIKSVRIEIKGYTGTTDLLVDSFSIFRRSLKKLLNSHQERTSYL